jgi:hypothetical protein
MVKIIKYVFLICIGLITFSNARAQILENYVPKIERKTSFKKLNSSEKINLKLDLSLFPESEFLIKIPQGSTLFVDDTLWFQSDVDTVFQIPLEVLKDNVKSFQKSNVWLTVINKKFNDGDVKVIKGFGELVSYIEQTPPPPTIYERRKIDRFDDFFYLSLFIPLFLLSLFKIIYPQFLHTIISPFDVFNGDDFSESSSLVKFFSIHIVFYLLILNMFLMALVMLIFKELFAEVFLNTIGNQLNQYFFYWLLGTIGLTLISILKFIYLRVISFIFKIQKFSFSHYFYVLRVLSIFILLSLSVIYILKLNDIGEISVLLEIIVSLIFWVYVFIILMLFLMIMNKVTYKNYHLFAYICMSELVPFLFISKIMIG